MQIKDPKFKEGQKVRDIEDGDIYTVVEINSYGFSGNEYWYDLEYLEDDKKKYIYTRPESKLETYIEKPKSVWELQKGDTYYAINMFEGETYQTIFYDNGYDLGKRELGNCFLTKKEAEYELERRKIEAEMLRLGGRRVFKKGENNYYIVCDFDSHYDIWTFNNKSDGFGIGTIYFDSAKEGSNAIDSIGEDRIKKYIFGVDRKEFPQ